MHPEETLEKKIRQKKRRGMAMGIAAVVLIVIIVIALAAKPKTDDAFNAEVTMEIRCDQLSASMEKLADKALLDYIPADGRILSETKCGIEAGKTTVFDVLERVCREKDIQMEYNSTPVYGGVYIEGIQYLYEFSAGKYSGWMFLVNGSAPGYGADKVVLNGDEKIVWYYVVDYQQEADVN